MKPLSHALSEILELIFHETSESRALPSCHEFFLSTLKNEPCASDDIDADIASFLTRAVQTIQRELEEMPQEHKQSLVALASLLAEHGFGVLHQEHPEARAHLWKIFCHEAYTLLKTHDHALLQDIDARIAQAQAQRAVRITAHNAAPITKPAEEILFTSNVLMTLPRHESMDSLDLSDEMKEKLRYVRNNEKQLYWYDHPMHFGINPSANEMLYGLKGLSDMVKYEKRHNCMAQDAKIKVALSVSVTHTSLTDLSKEYLTQELKHIDVSSDLEVYLYTEKDTAQISHILNEAIQEDSRIESVFGVDGRYGRHYNFLKAIAPLWQLCMDPRTKATFKIDLDQVFPQEELKAQSGKSALEHFTTPLWGAHAVDSNNRPIELGMIAGALVNEADISQGLFTPDVALPTEPLSPEELLFPRTLLMALSTRAELMLRYAESDVANGKDTAIQRIHVTGGTNGILISALKKYKPFTPSFIGRAEDQAYIMSVYYNEHHEHALRYVHASGLIMRHDKASFASDAIKTSKLGTYAGDLLRTILFSHFADTLKGGIAQFKTNFAPFTSAFSSATPVLASTSRLLVHCLPMDATAMRTQLQLAADTLKDALRTQDYRDTISKQLSTERKEWDNYYRAIDELSQKEALAGHREKIKNILSRCKITASQ